MPNVRIGDPSGWSSGLLRRLGIPQFGAWLLGDVVTPVALVDSSITLQAAAVTPLLGTPSTAGESVAPAANTRLADTGALAAGSWNFVILGGSAETVTSLPAFRVRRRNAADAADVWAHRVQVPGGSTFVLQLRLSINTAERVVVENVAAGTAGVTYQASIFATLG